MTIECQRWPEMPLILESSGTQYVAMLTKRLSSNCGAHLVESYCKECDFLSNSSMVTSDAVGMG